MPLTGERSREYQREYGKRQRAKRRLELLRGAVEADHKGELPNLAILGKAVSVPRWPDDPVQAVADWAERRLVVPAGRLQRKPFKIPLWQRDFLSDMFDPGSKEVWLTCAPKKGLRSYCGGHSRVHRSRRADSP